MITLANVEVDDYRFETFTQEFQQACQAAWLDGVRDVTVVRLPRGLFPELAELVNPITRSVVVVERVDLVAYCGCARPAWDTAEE